MDPTQALEGRREDTSPRRRCCSVCRPPGMRANECFPTAYQTDRPRWQRAATRERRRTEQWKDWAAHRSSVCRSQAERQTTRLSCPSPPEAEEAVPLTWRKKVLPRGGRVCTWSATIPQVRASDETTRLHRPSGWLSRASSKAGEERTLLLERERPWWWWWWWRRTSWGADHRGCSQHCVLRKKTPRRRDALWWGCSLRRRTF
mmetsp:Transcript_17615/g.52757  ORF Transcript_17615/g.52757 Transcript_17615/m.52757 type:complete len:203 (+) Transcript_17615:150-758(+)